jgi:hypothetical protein
VGQGQRQARGKVPHRKARWDADYVQSVWELPDDFEKYLNEHGASDPPAGPHREDSPWVVEKMRQPGCHVFIGAISMLKPKE